MIQVHVVGGTQDGKVITVLDGTRQIVFPQYKRNNKVAAVIRPIHRMEDRYGNRKWVVYGWAV